MIQRDNFLSAKLVVEMQECRSLVSVSQKISKSTWGYLGL